MAKNTTCEIISANLGSKLETLAVRLFDQTGAAPPPCCIVHAGCEDGSLLRYLYKLIRDRTTRGQTLATHPLQWVGITPMPSETIGASLAELPHAIVPADPCHTEQLLGVLLEQGAHPDDRIWHVSMSRDAASSPCHVSSFVMATAAMGLFPDPRAC